MNLNLLDRTESDTLKNKIEVVIYGLYFLFEILF